MTAHSLNRPVFLLIAGLGAPALAAVVGLLFSRYGSPLHPAAWFLLPALLAAGAGMYLRRPVGEILFGAAAAAALETLALLVIFMQVQGLS